MKTLFILALLALAATSAIAQLDTTYRQGYYEPRQQWQLQMNPCREFLRQQCSPVALPFLRSRMWQASSCQAMRQQCCRHLAQISEQSRCQAICGVAHAMTQQQQQQCQLGFCGPQQQAQLEVMRAMAVQILPAMCNVYVPAYCSTAATAPCSIAAATCAGGACY